ncbi:MULTISPECIES: AAA family ATPase [unclassified Psychrobacter]|uniref:AAA family ATPase n=1 Tax=unclassified Psychrobacter TaxID=196806 RepID=UPI000C339538|nr:MULTISPECIES: AAA family ATPase [unclassified Psychrobacter]MBA6243952.1 AAA family ATPase [Psychrobacter sp. Urea-trap-18]MBA6287168.1 AAA family ATPase [Psychrobacter sp. Urea-trap-16]MBA6318282.1 AAA family ATPase [Psychrobacter sp. Urea-trap-20]MBA6335226.1 AAA family ATPase [Psychrobacter sp. Urea-trap-19]PKG60387.1 chromosome segregation protein SMC [Psychrobacter sp. Choline-3u-12]
MRLKSLKLAGFKSFANPTTFTFRHGITAIVGPNGCGKSNVIDAIRWVLGETSAKQLRGGAMSDVIFAGTQDKTAKSVASVELTFEHTQDEQTGIRHEFNLYQELSVRRQVNKDGRSDYFINGTRCRRRDVVDVFLGTGLGARSYAVIEQGMIGRIVESSPVQLREFIEEAAGVSRYQARREETQKKLEKTKDNLARLHDMQSELLRQQKTLSKQAASAQRYEELALTLADIEQQLAIQQLYQAKQTHQQQKVAHERSAAEVSTLQADYDTLKAQQDKLTARINQEQWLKDDAQSAHYQQQLGYQQAEHKLSDAKSQLNAIEQQLSGLAQQRAQSLADIERLNSEQAEQNQALEVLRPRLIELTKKRDNYKRNEQPLQRAWHEAQNNLSRLQDKARSLEQQQAINTQAQKRHQQSHDKWQRREQNWQNLWQQLQQSIAPSASDSTDVSKTDKVQDLSQVLEQQVTELNVQLQQVERQREAVDERLSEIQPQAHSLQQRLNTQQSELSDYEKRHALLAGEYDTLHQILHPKSTQQQSAKSKVTATDNVDSDGTHHQPLAIATLREQIELSAKGQEYAPLLDSILALWLDSHVLVANQQANQTKQSSVDNANGISQQANSLWQALEHDVADLLTYQTVQNTPASAKDKALVETGNSLWLPTAQNSISDHNFVSDLPDSLIDKVLPLSQLIKQPTLALWQQCYIYTAQLETNKQHEIDTLTNVLRSLPPSAILLTVDGWLISRHGTINLSKFAGAQDSQSDSSSQFLTQRLQQRTRLQALEDLLDEFESKIQEQQKSIAKDQRDYDALMVSLEETRAQAEQLTRDKHQYQQQLTTERANAERLQADSQRLNADKATLEQEKQELVQEQQTLEQEQQHIESEIATLTPQIAEARATTQQLQAERSDLNRARQVDDDAWQALQLRIQQYEMRLEHSVSSLDRATEQHDKSLENEQSLQMHHDQQQAKLPELQATLQSAQTTRDEQQVLLNERDTALTALKQTYAEQQTAFDTLQNTLQTQQSELARHATELALSAARLEDASAHTQSALDAYYRVSHKYKAQAEQPRQSMSVSNLLADFIAHDRRVRPDKIAELESERAKLTQQLSKIGPVNLAAVAELAEVNERLDPLAQQTADIAASMQTLTEAIASIDETTKTLFMQTLDAVNNELANLFAKVFGGGQASLTLNTDEMPANTPKSEQWRAGLTLMAQPKGKRNSRLAVLSGGEKTLTALSLIFAIFKQHPAPFCVLDEVDAPLDDANVARFTSLIHELADDLQFIFISHNKLTMQTADELKGITMPSAGISTLVSVSLDEAARYVES